MCRRRRCGKPSRGLLGARASPRASPGETAEGAAATIEEHMGVDHPELVGKVTREDLVAMAEEA